MLDFYSPEYKLGIEIDGGKHYEDKGKREDDFRTIELAKQGIGISRFSNLDVLKNIDGVYEVIKRVIENKKDGTPHLSPLPKGERRSS